MARPLSSRGLSPTFSSRCRGFISSPREAFRPPESAIRPLAVEGSPGHPYSSVTQPITGSPKDNDMSFIQALEPNLVLMFFGVLLISMTAAVIALLADY